MLRNSYMRVVFRYAGLGNAEGIRELLASGFPVNTQNEVRLTALNDMQPALAPF